MDYVSSKEWSPHVLLLPQEAGQGLDVRAVVYTGNVSFSRLAG